MQLDPNASCVCVRHVSSYCQDIHWARDHNLPVTCKAAYEKLPCCVPSIGGFHLINLINEMYFLTINWTLYSFLLFHSFVWWRTERTGNWSAPQPSFNFKLTCWGKNKIRHTIMSEDKACISWMAKPLVGSDRCSNNYVMHSKQTKQADRVSENCCICFSCLTEAPWLLSRECL